MEEALWVAEGLHHAVSEYSWYQRMVRTHSHLPRRGYWLLMATSASLCCASCLEVPRSAVGRSLSIGGHDVS